MYIQANIGRNIDNTPMTDTQWDTFTGSVAFAIYAAATDSGFDPLDVEIHNGTGSYAGISEDSRHLSAYSEAGFDLDSLRAELREIKGWYGQDAIALIVGSELI